MSPDFKAKRHTNRFWLGLCPRPGQLNGAYFYGKGCKEGKGGKGGEGRGRGRGEERKGKREGKRKGGDGTPLCVSLNFP